jgi:ribonucleoside-diphosphate reductase alpha chain
MRLKGVVQKRYLAETLEELAADVSSVVGSSSSQVKDVYYDLMIKKKFFPAGNTLLAGRQPIRPNCCILPTVSDENLSETIERSARLWQNRIGIGFDLSLLSDPVAALRQLSMVNRSIDLGHRPQRGNMAVLNINHPRIADFIAVKAKYQSLDLYNFNISVALSSSDLSFTSDLSNAKKEEIVKLLAQSAWETGDPGIVFLDRIGCVPDSDGNGEKLSVPHLGQCTTVVPCGEQSMFPNEVCTLGSINLACSDFWQDYGNDLAKDSCEKMPIFKKHVFEECVRLSVQFLDDVVDIMDIEDEALKAMSQKTRRIGLGVMGFADVLARCNIGYGSLSCLQLIETIGSSFKEAAHDASRQLGRQRGVCPALVGTGVNRRNLTVTCIAPTGGITLLTENKGYSIEPFFEDAHNISVKDHLKVQSKWQQYVCNCISKTVNLKSTASPEDIQDLFIDAAHTNVKSVTVYRDQSKKGQPLPMTSSSLPKHGLSPEADCLPEAVSNGERASGERHCRSGMCDM